MEFLDINFHYYYKAVNYSLINNQLSIPFCQFVRGSIPCVCSNHIHKLSLIFITTSSQKANKKRKIYDIFLSK